MRLILTVKNNQELGELWHIIQNACPLLNITSNFAVHTTVLMLVIGVGLEYRLLKLETTKCRGLASFACRDIVLANQLFRLFTRNTGIADIEGRMVLKIGKLSCKIRNMFCANMCK